MKENIEYIDLYTDYERTYRIYNKDIIEFDINSKNTIITSPEEMFKVKIPIVNNLLLIINEIEDLINLDGDNIFDYKNERINQIEILYKNEKICNFFVDRYEDETPSQLIDINNQNNLFITIENKYK